MTNTFDFRRGQSHWGHALHTWEAAPPRVEGHLWWRKHFERVSAIVHASPPPYEGDRLIYSTKDGTRAAVVVDVKCFMNPRDMFELILEETPSQS